MPANRVSLPAVTIAGVVAIIFGLFTALGSVLFALVLVLMPQMQNAPGMPPFPAEMRAIFTVFVVFFLVLGILGNFVGVGVIRRRNWARVTILVWGGIMTLFCLALVAFSFVMFNSNLGVDLPNVNGVDTAKVMVFTRIFTMLFYGIPAAIGIWWLVLFTRPRVALAFTSPQPSLPAAMDASGFPQPALASTPMPPPRAACPLPIAVVAGLMALGSVFMLIFAFTPLPSSMPMFFLGHSFNGPSAKGIFLLWGGVSGASAVGIFLLKPWALHTQIGLQCLGILNCAIAALSPNYPAAMRAAVQKIYADNPMLTANSPFMTDGYFRSLMVFSTLLIGILLFVLVWQRPRFLEQAVAMQRARA